METGYALGTGINGYHWYADPFDLYSDYTVDHLLELLGENTTFYNYNLANGQDVYFLAAIVLQPDPEPFQPVPEPDNFSTVLLLILFYFLNQLTKKNRSTVPRITF